MKVRILLPALLLLASGCNFLRSKQAPTEIDTAQTEPQISPDMGHPIDYDNTPMLKAVFVINRDGLDARQDPAPNSAVLASYQYGDELGVIEDAGDYYGIRERISRQYEEDGHTVISSGWEKIYIPKAATGTFDQIELCQTDLNQIISLSENIDGEMRSTSFEKPEPLNRYLAIELIDKRLYDEKRLTAVDFLTADTTAIVKNNGRIVLPCTNGAVTYTDVDSEGDNYRAYRYVGHIDSLNAYVIESWYYENWDFQLVDRTDSATTYLVDYPHLSPDRKHLFSITANPYEATADMEVYTIRGHKATGLVFASFANWMPITTETKERPVFWASDNCLYLAVNHVKVYWEKGDYNDRHQYIRIKIVEP